MGLDVKQLLKGMVELEASDLYLTVDRPPMYRVHGTTIPTKDAPLTNEQLETLAISLMRGTQRDEFETQMEMNMALYYKELGRFRVNAFRQRGNVGLVFRHIKAYIVPIDGLGLPPILKDIAMTKRGLVLVVGATGCGKSTTLAAMIDHRNKSQAGHIVTVEDPIEFVHEHRRSIITQREVGFDTLSYQSALRNTLRQAPDVILIGEIRDLETMEAAITFAETGHLCLATLHSNNANQAIERIMNFFTAARHAQIYLQLSLNLRAIISQRLIPSIDGRRVPACEIMVDTPRIRDLVKKGEIDTLKEAMEQGFHEGCQTFDQVLFEFYRKGLISAEQALINADSVNNIRLKIKLESMKGRDPSAGGSPTSRSDGADSGQRGSGYNIRGAPPSQNPTRRP